MNPQSQMSSVNGPMPTGRQEVSGKAGFTILEFLIYISVFSVMALVVGGSFLSINSGRARNESRAEVNSATRVVMERIKDDLKNATSVIAPGIGTNSPYLWVVVNTDNITYDLNSSGVVRRWVNSTPYSITSSNVIFTNINFEHLQNVNIPLLKIAQNIKVDLSAGYSTTDPARVYSQINRSTFSLGRLFDIVRPSGLLDGEPINVHVPVCALPGQYCTNPPCETYPAGPNNPPYCPPEIP